MKPTVEQIYEALSESIEYHMGAVRCTIDNYKEYLFGVSYCPLCIVVRGGCDSCVLHSDGGCAQEYYDGQSAAEVALVERLERLRDEHKAKIDSKSKPICPDSVKVQFRCTEDAKKSKQPKYAMGKEVWWDGVCNGTAAPVKAQKVEICKHYSDDAYQIKLSPTDYYGALATSLSPLPEMYVGKEWTLEQEGHICNGMLMKCVREGPKSLAWEWGYHFDRGQISQYDRTQCDVVRFISICIAPAFWTGEICGYKIRAYYDIHEDVVVKHNKGENNSGTWRVQESPHFRYLILLDAIKKAGIHIAPFGYFDEMIPPED